MPWILVWSPGGEEWGVKPRNLLSAVDMAYSMLSFGMMC
jgi:hypothetical protein